jgi:hypothetical protein
VIGSGSTSLSDSASNAIQPYILELMATEGSSAYQNDACVPDSGALRALALEGAMEASNRLRPEFAPAAESLSENRLGPERLILGSASSLRDEGTRWA